MTTITAACIGAAVLILVSPACPSQEVPKISHDGLELVERKPGSEGMAVVYVRPGATLAGYKRVMLDPVDIAFDPSWKPRPKVTAASRERIRRELAEGFRSVFTEELEKSGYQIVDVAGPDVLRVTAAIVDLSIEVPGVATSERFSTYDVVTSRMSLIGELRDAETGAILARVADRQVGSSSGRMPGVVRWTTSAANRADARRALSIWADRLRTALDSARSAAETSAPR